MLPKITHLFRITRDPELRYGQSGTALCKLGLVASDKYKDKETTLWLDATAFGKTAELLNSTRKGQRIFITGRLQTDQWINSEGQKQSKTTMTIEGFEYVEKRDDSQPQQPPVHYENANGQPMPPPQQQMPQNTSPGFDINEDEIPW